MRRRSRSMRRRGSRVFRRRLSTSFKRFRRGRGRYVDKKAFKREVRSVVVANRGTAAGVFNLNPEILGTITQPCPSGWNFGGSIVVASPIATTVAYPVIGSAGQYDLPFSMAFFMSDVLNYTEFQVLFDQYKLNYIVIKFTPTWNSNTNGTYVGTIPSIEFMRDCDDVTLPTEDYWAQVASKKGPIMFDKPITIKLKPSMLMAALYNPQTPTTFATTMKSRYNNAAMPDVGHFGIKGMIRNLYAPGAPLDTNPGNNLFRVEATYYFTMKGLQ